MIERIKQFDGDLRAVMSLRLGAATTRRILSTRDEKTLSVREEPDGHQFVSRVYDEGAENEYKLSGLSFAETLEVMTDMYRAAGIDVVKSSVLPVELTEGKVTVLSEYLSDAVPLKNAPLEAKQEAICGLAKLLDPSIDFLPTSQALMKDLFMAQRGEDNQLHPIIVDIDPRVARKEKTESSKDEEIATHLRQTEQIIRGLADDDREAAELAHTFFTSVDEAALGDGMLTLYRLLSMHSLSQGSPDFSARPAST